MATAAASLTSAEMPPLVNGVYSVSGQLSETFRLPIKSQPVFITRTSGLLHSIARCLVSLETEFQFRDVLTRKMTLKVLEHVIDELLDDEMNYRMALLLCTL